MAVTDTLPPKGPGGKIGGIKKEYAYGAIAIGGIVIIVVYMRSKSQSSATNSAGTVTDPAGNVCAALSPSSGYCPGTPEDLAYAGNTATGSGGLVGANNASYVGGQIIGYDQYGNPIYSSNSGQGNTGPGTFTNNASWAQAAQTYLIDNEPNADPGVIGAALGAYINGHAVTDAQRSIIEQAIAFEGSPPVAGTDGVHPPGIVQGSGGTGTPPPVTKSATNPVKGLRKGTVNFDNFDVLWDASPNATGYTVTTTKAGRQVNQQKVTGTSAHIGHMQQGVRYTVRVWATPDPKKGTPASITLTTKKGGK